MPHSNAPELVLPEPLLIADNRVAFCPDRTVLLDDETVGTMGPVMFRLAVLLGSDPDRVHTYPEQQEAVWQSPAARKHRTLLTLHTRLRHMLGDELRDPEQGAIRHHMHIGSYAVKSRDAGYIPEAKEGDEAYQLASGLLVVNVTRWNAVCDGRLLEGITPAELNLLKFFASHPDTKFSGRDAEKAIQSEGDPSNSGAFRIHMSRLRKRLGPQFGDSRTGILRTTPDNRYYYGVGSFEKESD